MRWIAVAIALAVPTVGAAQMSPAELLRLERQSLRREIEYYQRLVAEQIKDPESAVFRDVWIQARQGAEIQLCGQINAKGAGGGYVGFSNFMATIDGTFPRHWVSLYLESDKPDETVRMTCRILAPR